MIRSLLSKDAFQKPNAWMPFHEVLIHDLNLDQIFDAAANGDNSLRTIVKKMMLCSESPSHGDIIYRQTILQEMIPHTETIQALYSCLSESLQKYHAFYRGTNPAFASYVPMWQRTDDQESQCRLLLETIHAMQSILSSVDSFISSKHLHDVFLQHTQHFNKDFLQNATELLQKIHDINHSQSISVNATIGAGFKGHQYEISHPLPRNSKTGITIPLPTLNLRTQAEKLKDAMLKNTISILKHVNTTVVHQLQSLSFELGFYCSCLNLYQHMQRLHLPWVFPVPCDRNPAPLRLSNLVDLGLGLQNQSCPVGNEIHFDDARLCIISGANQGGKSTYLRSLGCALLMMRCGMFVSATHFESKVPSCILSHFSQADPQETVNGRLDEELHRFSDIIDQLDPHAVLLMNESFSSTSETIAQGIASEIIPALYDRGVQVVFVTHMFAFAQSLAAHPFIQARFLRAVRSDDGSRSYKLICSPPEATSYGMDIYYDVFGH